MREAGGEMESGPVWQPFSVVDDNVVTGQNPASSSEVAQKTVERLDARARWIHVVPYKEHAPAHGEELVIHGRSGRIRDAVAIH
jgi:hypothetical protein